MAASYRKLQKQRKAQNRAEGKWQKNVVICETNVPFMLSPIWLFPIEIQEKAASRRLRGYTHTQQREWEWKRKWADAEVNIVNSNNPSYTHADTQLMCISIYAYACAILISHDDIGKYWMTRRPHLASPVCRLFLCDIVITPFTLRLRALFIAYILVHVRNTLTSH